MITVTDNELQKAQLDKKMLKRSLPKRQVSVPEQKVDDNSAATKQLAEAVKRLAESQVGRQIDRQDLTPVIDALIRLQETQQAILSTILEQEPPAAAPSQWEFAVERDNKGAITKIRAKGA